MLPSAYMNLSLTCSCVRGNCKQGPVQTEGTLCMVSVLKFKCVCNEVCIRPHEYKVGFK